MPSTDIDGRRIVILEAVAEGKDVTIFQPGPFGGGEPDNVSNVAVEGPHAPMSHTWYAQVTVRDGKVVKVM